MSPLRAALAALIVVALGLPLYLLTSGPDSGTRSAAPFGAPFVLRDASGQAFDSALLQGKPHALFFGFTHCPDICPTTLAEMTLLLKQMGAQANRLKVVFITVDPERDTVAELRDYLSSFDPRIIGLTGAPESIARVVKAYGIAASKEPLANGGYTINHTASVILIDRRGDFAGTLAQGEPISVKRAKLENLLAR